jgi:hypothetical protein
MGRLTWEGQCGSRSLGTEVASTDFSRLSWRVLPVDRFAGGNSGIAQLMREASAGMRIVGGQNVPDGWFPETVALYAKRGAEPVYCTGLLLSDTAVLTAGHCVCELGLDRAPAGAAESTLTVRFGPNAGAGQDFSEVGIDYTRTVLYEPELCTKRARLGDLAVRGNDVAIVFLSQKLKATGDPKFLRDAILTTDPQSREGAGIQMGEKVAAPVRIASPQLVHSQFAQLVIVGYGFNNTQGQQNRIAVKTWASVPVASYICGWPLEQGLYRCAPGLETVLIDVLGRDTCGGDSGGPAFLFFGPGLYYLIGITSRGVARSGECGAGGIYTLMVPRIVDWVRRTAGLQLVSAQ